MPGISGKEQKVVGQLYEGVARGTLRKHLVDIANRDGFIQSRIGKLAGKAFAALVGEKTTIFAGSPNLDRPAPAVQYAANQLTEKILAFRAMKENKDEPINIFAHSNGTMVALIAARQSFAKGVRVNTLVLAGSPLDARGDPDKNDNIKTIKQMLANNEVGKIYNVYSQWDLVTGVVGGAQPWPIPPNKQFANVDMSTEDPGMSIPVLKVNFDRTYGPLKLVKWVPRPGFGFTWQTLPTIGAHGRLADPDWPFGMRYYASVLRWDPKGS
jgi:hypothetical protein